MATTYKKGELQDHEGKQLLPRTKAALVETEDGSNVEEKLGTFLPFSGGTMTGPAVGAPGAIATPQFRNVQYGTEPLTPGESPLPQGTLYITPEARGEAGDWKQVVDNNAYTLHVNPQIKMALVTLKSFDPVTIKVSAPSFEYGNFSVIGGSYSIVKYDSHDVIPAAYRTKSPASANQVGWLVGGKMSNGNQFDYVVHVSTSRQYGDIQFRFDGIYNSTESFELEIGKWLREGGITLLYSYEPYEG